eukprot:m.889321 g.889321  ORF g.889321 m.889321 type:complete len:1153 (-) comp59941_c0_seq5:1399-4857(-)
MKERFTSVDVQVIVAELQHLVGLRAANVYDMERRGYLVKLVQADRRALLLIHSGIRIHTTQFTWPKNPAPSGFAMKCRKHIRTRRLTSIRQLGVDRIVDLCFGSGEAAYHLIVELYDRGNIILTDFEYTILSLLRPRVDNEDVKFAVRERYPVEVANLPPVITLDLINTALVKAKAGDPLRKVLVPILSCGAAMVEHCLLQDGFKPNAKIGDGFDPATDMDRLMNAVTTAETYFQRHPGTQPGYIVLKVQPKPPKSTALTPKGQSASASASTTAASSAADELLLFDEFHPFLPCQHQDKQIQQFPSFDRAVDTFFSELESQKLDLQAIQQEQAVMRKLQNVKDDHDRRLKALQEAQLTDVKRAQLIEAHLELVDRAILIISSAVSNSVDWTEIEEMVKDAKALDDPVAKHIVKLKLAANKITMNLSEPVDIYDSDDDMEDKTDSEPDSDEEVKPGKPRKPAATQPPKKPKTQSFPVDIDLSLTAYANSRKYFDQKRAAAQKQQKTIEASSKALKNAERKTHQALKEVAVHATITKARKPYWFEKFLWFITSERFLVIGGRDRQQNEMLVKKYLQKGDIYVHADLHGAASCILKNPTGLPVPPKSLNEAGNFAIINSGAWDAKIVANAYWVNHDQVSKTAPAGEYLTTGSFMIRGKKNYLPPGMLVAGFGVLFKIDESCIPNHLLHRKSKVESEADALSRQTSEPSQPEVDLDDGKESDPEEQATTESAVPAEPAEPVDDPDVREEPEDKEPAEESQPAGEAPLAEQDASDGSESGSESDAESNDEFEDAPSEPAASAAFEYPDTSIEFSYDKTDSVQIKKQVSSEVSHHQREEVADDDEEQAGAGVSTKKRLSAKQRQLLKKGVPLAEILAAPSITAAAQPVPERKDTAPKPGRRPEPQPAPKASAEPKRGQHSKLRKIKEKYAEQDEEDRELALKLLGSQGTAKPNSRQDRRKQRKEQGQIGSKQRVATGAQGSKLPEAAASLLQDPQQTASAAPKPRQEKGHEPMQARKPNPAEATTAPAEEDDNDDDDLGQLLAEENIQLLAEDDKDNLTFLDGLVESLLPDDVLLYALPVCAPYSAMSSYKYKIKLIPGTTKRGRAGKLAMGAFLHQQDVSAHEKDLIKCIKDEEIVRCMPSKVKVMASAAVAATKRK